MLIDREVRKMTTDVLSFDEVVDLIRSRMFDADAIDSSKLHDLKELVSDYAAVIPEGWYQDAFDELQAQGHLHDQSGGTFGSPFGRLSADGRLYVRDERAE
jgi:hypothetical protein